jgi:uncharacterized membrane protein YeaQ/YmgE (transglycosylase-associated protein family)
MDPLIVFLLVLVIGIVVGLLFQNVYRRGWLVQRLTGGGAGVTSALVGIAGAFIGFHVFALAGVISTLLVLLGALIGAIIVVWAWRAVRF